MSQSPPTIATALRALFATGSSERLELREIVAALGERGFGCIMLLFVLPNTIPGPAMPGLSFVTGVPLALVALQMAFGYRRPVLPDYIASRSIDRGRFARLIERAAPYLHRVEERLRPRLAFLHSGSAARIIAAACALLAAVMALPVPFGNLPLAWGIMLLSLGLVSRDGLLVLWGVVVGLMATAWNLFLIVAGYAAIGEAVAWAKTLG